MAAVLVPPNKIQDKDMNFTVELSNFVDRAADQLMLKDFGDCRKTCMCGLARAKLFIDDDRHNILQEKSTVFNPLPLGYIFLHICDECRSRPAGTFVMYDQDLHCWLLEAGINLWPIVNSGDPDQTAHMLLAMAEMNQWQDVLPLIQDIYTGIEFCPSAVIQICVLLHARVKEYSQCHALASLWLRCKDNSCRTGYDRVASLYIEHAMLPLNRLLLVPQFLNSCTHLSEEVKDRIIKHSEELNAKLLEKAKQKDLSKVEDETMSSSNRNSSSDTRDKTEVNLNESDTTIVQYLKYVGCFLSSKLSFPTLDSLLKISAAVVTLALLAKFIFRGDKTYTLGKMSVLWQNMMKVFRAVLTPYRPGR